MPFGLNSLIKWGENFSIMFCIGSRLRQGSDWNPFLFSLGLDDLIKRLRFIRVLRCKYI